MFAIICEVSNSTSNMCIGSKCEYYSITICYVCDTTLNSFFPILIMVK